MAGRSDYRRTGPNGVTRECRECNNRYPEDEDHFRLSRTRAQYSSRCRWCDTERDRRRWADKHPEPPAPGGPGRKRKPSRFAACLLAQLWPERKPEAGD